MLTFSGSLSGGTAELLIIILFKTNKNKITLLSLMVDWAPLSPEASGSVELVWGGSCSFGGLHSFIPCNVQGHIETEPDAKLASVLLQHCW